MSDEDRAYAAALAEIERVKATGETALILNKWPLHALERIPEEVAGIEGLQTLSLDRTNVSELTPISACTGLQALSLIQTNVSDLTPISACTGLKTLSLTSTNVSDLTPISACKGLESLSLDQTKVSDLKPIRTCTGLQTLFLNQTKVSDLTPISACTGLETLSLTSTNVSDLTPISVCTGLQILSLTRTKVNDLTPISACSGLQILSIYQTNVSDLTPLRACTGLETLSLDQTKVSDLTPISACTGLKRLYLTQTKVSDLTSISACVGLQYLSLEQTNVTDLRVVSEMPELGDSSAGGLWFADTPVAESSDEWRRIAGMDDAKERAKAARAYVATLPPYPEPLPWEVPEGPLPLTPPPALEVAGVPRFILTADQRIDLEPSEATEEDISDPIKQRLYERLPEAAKVLQRFGNRYVEVKSPADTLASLCAAEFAEADMLSIHLEIAALSDVRDADAKRPEAERMDAECMAAVNGVLRIGPPVTMGHPDVDLLEERNREFANRHLPATVGEGERRLTGGLSKADDLATQRTRDMAAQMAEAGDEGRMAAYRNGFTRNSIIWMAVIGGTVTDAAVGHVVGPPVGAAVDFIWLYKNEIMAVAGSWGETGTRWAEYVITMAREAIRKRGCVPE